MRRGEWWESAECWVNGADPVLFDDAPSGNPPRVQPWDRYCGVCVVRTECLEDALSVERDGSSTIHTIRGGLTPKQRYKLLHRNPQRTSRAAG